MSSWLRVQSGCVLAGCRCLSVYLPVKDSRLPLTLRQKKNKQYMFTSKNNIVVELFM